MYVPQHAAPRHRGSGRQQQQQQQQQQGRHRRTTGTRTATPGGRAAEASLASAVTGLAAAGGGASGRHAAPSGHPLAGTKPGAKIATSVSAVTLGAGVGVLGMGAPAHADGETLNFKEIAGVVKDVGLPCVTGTAIAYGESSGDTDINAQFPGEDSRGLFQINEVHGFDFDWDDPHANARMAKKIYRDAGGWGPWGAYTDGRYKNYLDEARAACDDPSQVGGGGQSGGSQVQPVAHEEKNSDNKGDNGDKGQEKARDGNKGAGKSTYTVEKGDTLSEIAGERGTTWRHLWKMNDQIENPDVIHPGDKIDVSGHPLD